MVSKINEYLGELLQPIEEGADSEVLREFVRKVRRESYVKGVLLGLGSSPENPPYLPEEDE